MTPGKILTLALGALLALSTPSAARTNYSGLNFSAHDITTLASAGVTPEYIQKIRELGYKDISAHEMHNQLTWNTIAKNIAMALALAVIGLAIYYIYRKSNTLPATNPLDTRINNFEKRVGDLQDILISIDDRLSRQLNRI